MAVLAKRVCKFSCKHLPQPLICKVSEPSEEFWPTPHLGHNKTQEGTFFCGHSPPSVTVKAPVRGPPVQKVFKFKWNIIFKLWDTSHTHTVHHRGWQKMPYSQKPMWQDILSCDGYVYGKEEMQNILLLYSIFYFGRPSKLFQLAKGLNKKLK